MQDIEFTIERGQALHAADAQRQAHRPRRGQDRRRHGEGEADRPRRRRSCASTPSSIDQLLHPASTRRPRRSSSPRACRPRPAPPSARSSSAPTTPRPRRRPARRSILVRVETSPEDIHGMTRRRGILTARGGMTSHAAVVARGMGKRCVAGCSALEIDYAGRVRHAPRRHARRPRRRDHARRLDRRGVPRRGADGRGRAARAATSRPSWAGPTSPAASRSAPTPTRRRTRTSRASSAPRASASAAPSTCSSTADRIVAVREMILADDLAGRERALAKLLPMQRGDFVGDLPRDGRACRSRSASSTRRCTSSCRRPTQTPTSSPPKIGVDPAKMRARREQLHEFNPMLGIAAAGSASPIPRST